jgi:hypothetical protein
MFHVKFVVGTVAQGKLSSEYFGFPLPVTIPAVLHALIFHPRLMQWIYLWPKYQGVQSYPTRKIKKGKEIKKEFTKFRNKELQNVNA